MKILAAKFGGSSVSDAEGFRRVRNILRKRSCRQYIVLSAPGKRCPGDDKITDLLLRAQTDESARAAVRLRFSEIAEALQLSLPDDAEFNRCSDFAAHRGEYLCARLFSQYAGLPFADASDLIFFDRFGNLDSERTFAAIRAMASRLSSAVIPGFYGSMPDGSIRTFERGGSDITGALVAAAVGADVYENWTDVNGLMSADPQLCADAVAHPAVSYRQMQSLSLAGAQVLHPCCLDPVRRASIPTLLKNTFRPELPGTYISDQVRGDIPCVCIRKGLCAVYAEELDRDARIIAEGAGLDSFFSGEGRRLFAFDAKNGCIGRPSSLISAFALPMQQCEDVFASAGHIGARFSPDRLSLLADPIEAPVIARRLHDLLLGRRLSKPACSGA